MATERIFRVKGLCCGSEVMALKQEVGPRVGGEQNLTFDLLQARMTVLVGTDEASDEQVIVGVRQAGLNASPVGHRLGAEKGVRNLNSGGKRCQEPFQPLIPQAPDPGPPGIKFPISNPSPPKPPIPARLESNFLSVILLGRNRQVTGRAEIFQFPLSPNGNHQPGMFARLKLE